MSGVDTIMKDLQGYKEKLKGFKEKAEQAKLERVRNESRLEALKKTESELIEHIRSMGYDPDNLEGHIEEKTKQLEAVVKKLDSVMPDESGAIPENALELLGLKIEKEALSNTPKSSAEINEDDYPF